MPLSQHSTIAPCNSIAKFDVKIMIFASAVFFGVSMLWLLYGHSQIVAPWVEWLPGLFFRDEFSEILIRDSLLRYQEQGDNDLGGFMMAFEQSVHIATVKIIDGPGVNREVYPYISHFNLQYVVAKLLQTVTITNSATGFSVLRLFNLALMSVTVGLMCGSLSSMFGERSAMILLAIFTGSPMFIERAASVYWMTAFSFFPFVFALAFYDGMRSARFKMFLVGIAALVALKSLTGYEYLSNIAIGAVIPVIYCEVRNVDRLTWQALVLIVRKGALVFLATVAGFALAALLHILKAALLFGSLKKGVLALTMPFFYSTIGSEAGIRGSEAPVVSEMILTIIRTFVAFNGHITVLLLALVLVGSIGPVLRARGSYVNQSERFSRFALVCALAISFVASASWSLLAMKHAAFHPHNNWIQLYLYFSVFAAAYCGEVSPEETHLT